MSVCEKHNLPRTDRHNGVCEQCYKDYHKAYNKAYRERNKARIAEQQAAYYQANKVEINEYLVKRRRALRGVAI